MSRATLAVLLISGSWAQTPADFFDRAPAEVDEALRGRIARFYQAHVDKKFREADRYVADDTKDFYYEASKPAYLAFEIDKISYSDNFTKAKAVVVCKMRFTQPGFTETPMMVPTPSTWKLENGEWYWYVDQKLGRETPFGVMKPPDGASPAAPAPQIPSGPELLEKLMKSVQANKNGVELNARKESSDEVIITNKVPGIIRLAVSFPKTAGLRVFLDQTELKSGEQAKLSMRFQPLEDSSAKTIELNVVVQPSNQVIPITVNIR